MIERAIKCLDRIPPYDTHKIGVIYVAPGQHDNESAILGNVYGSSRYMSFLSGLGTLVRLRDCPPAEIYTGGLDRNGEDGEYAYSWQDDICQGKDFSLQQTYSGCVEDNEIYIFEMQIRTKFSVELMYCILVRVLVKKVFRGSLSDAFIN